MRASHISPLLLVATLALAAGAAGHYLNTTKGSDAVLIAAAAPVLQQTLQSVTESAPLKALNKATASVALDIQPKPLNVTRETELDQDQTFAELLTSAGVSTTDAAAAMNALSKVYSLRQLKEGQDVTLYLSRTDKLETFNGATFQPEATKEISVTRNAQGLFTANIKLIPVQHQRLAAYGEIHTSLLEAGNRAGVPHALMAALIRIYSHDIDFQRDIHAGDSFQILYDQAMTTQGKAVGEGSILYAAIKVGGKVKPIYRMTQSDNSVDYFDAQGQSIRRALLRTPVAAAHITSGFGMRVHPLLGYSKMHKGVDFGATTGTPIFAAGSGTIDDIGFKNGYGRYIRIRHNGTLETAYAHMSRFGGSMYQGAHVSQGEVIGYVGMSGRATGPHLHFEVLVGGNQVNPLSINLPSGRGLEGKALAAFRQNQTHIQQEFNSLTTKPHSAVPLTNANTIQASVSTAAVKTRQVASN